MGEMSSAMTDTESLHKSNMPKDSGLERGQLIINYLVNHVFLPSTGWNWNYSTVYSTNTAT